MAFIQFEGIHKSFGSLAVLKGIDLAVEKGDFVTLLGPSGCGKSTLLRCLAGLETVDAGRILLDGEDITALPPQNRGVGMVFQQYSLFPNLNVYDNIVFGLKRQRLPKIEIRARVESLIAAVELVGKEGAMPATLSGGQQQRVALARSLATQPKVLLLDEPLSAIDAKLRKSLRAHILELHRAFDITCVFVTHDQDEALLMSDTIHLFNAGLIEQSDAPIQLYTRPKTRFAAGFIGNYNILSAPEFASLTGQETHGESIAIRPEAIELFLNMPVMESDTYVLPATVRDYTTHGNVLRYTVEANGVQLETDTLFRSFALHPTGERVYLRLEKRNCLQVS